MVMPNSMADLLKRLRHLTRETPHTTAVGAAALLALVGVLGFFVSPTYGRWEIPQTVPPAEVQEAVRDPAATSTPEPTATAVLLPDEAQVPILMYHYVSELPEDADVYRQDLTVPPDAFEAQLAYLDEAGYRPISLTDLHLHLTEGYPLPDKPVVLTFDDGYRDAYEVVFPKLLDHGFTGTFFVLATPAHYESDAYLTWSQMREMSEAGMDIQAHGRDHVDLRGRSYDFLVYQTLGIREAIEFHTGRTPRFFCYPAGRWDDDVIDVLDSAGYWGAVTTEWGRTQTYEDRFTMPRLRVRGEASLESFVAWLEGE